MQNNDAQKAHEEMVAKIRMLEAELAEAKQAARDAKPRKADAQPKPCACGCGGETKRTFLPGHDQRHRGNLLRQIRAGGSEGEAALEALLSFPNLAHGASRESLRLQLGSDAAKDAAKQTRELERLQKRAERLERDRAKYAEAAARETTRVEPNARQSERLENKERAKEAARTGQM